MKYLLLVIALLNLFACKPQPGAQSDESQSFGSTAPAATPTPAARPNVTSVSFFNNQLIVTGTNMDSATALSLTDGGAFDESFAIETRTASIIVANSLQAVGIAIGAVLYLIVEDAQGAATFAVSFTLSDDSVTTSIILDGAVTTDKINDSAVTAVKLNDMGASTGQVMTYNGTNWEPRNFNGLTYKGSFDATNAADETPSGTGALDGGDFFVCSVAGALDPDDADASGITWGLGDWAVWDYTNSTWKKLPSTDLITSVAGRTGDIVLVWADVDKTGSKLSDLANVNIASPLTSLVENDILVWDNTNNEWVAQSFPTATDIGLGNVLDVAQIPASDLDTTTTLGTSDTKVPSQNAVKTYVDAAVTAGDTSAAITCAAGEYLNGDGSCITMNATAVGLGNVTNVAQMPLSYLNTITSLGTSDLLVPSQNAVKTYVDTQVAGSTYTGGTGITLTGTVFSADLGTAIDSTEITDGTIVSADINAAAAIPYSKLSIAANDLAISQTSGLQTALDAKFLSANVDTDTTLATATDTEVPSQLAIKTYVDTQVAGSTYTGGTGITLTGTVFSADLGTAIDSTEITDGTIVSADINAAAAIPYSKLSIAANDLAISQTSGLQTALDAKQSTLTNSAGLAGALTDETGSGVAVFATAPTISSPVINTAVSGSAVLDDDTMATASATTLATSESIKAYVDAQTDSDTTYSAGTGLSLSSTTFSIAAQGISDTNMSGIATVCGNGEVLKTNGLGSFACLTLDNSVVGLANVTNVAQMPLSYLSTTTTLGTSDVLVPSQNAVKSYVDTAVAAADFDSDGTVAMAGNIKLNGNWLSNDGGSEGVFVDATGNVGIGDATPSYILDVAGDMQIQGSGATCVLGAGTGATSCTSDERLKDDIVNIPNALEKVKSLRGVEFVWNAENRNAGKKAMGVIAQDVLAAFPLAVITNAEGYLSVDYAVLVAPLIEAVKELDANLEMARVMREGIELRVANNERKIASLEEKVEKLESENKQMKEVLCELKPDASFCL